jgi:GntR family transcriptional repressor for pyruvate dehydrogenase complex
MAMQKQTGTTPTPAELTAALGGSIETATAVSEVTRRLMGYFTSDAINPGDRLPPERQLAQSMGVGRSAVREAIAALEVLGVVTVRPGSGTYLRGKASELLPQTLSWGMLIGAPKTRELIAVRHGLEVHAARLAARSATPQAIKAIGEHLQVMESSTADYEAFVAADMRFHQAVAAAAGSALLSEILQTARSLIRVWVERALSDPGHARLALSEHRTVFEAIRDGEPDRAAAAMNTHMDSAAERLSASLGETERE